MCVFTCCNWISPVPLQYLKPTCTQSVFQITNTMAGRFRHGIRRSGAAICQHDVPLLPSKISKPTENLISLKNHLAKMLHEVTKKGLSLGILEEVLVESLVKVWSSQRRKSDQMIFQRILAGIFLYFVKKISCKDSYFIVKRQFPRGGFICTIR